MILAKTISVPFATAGHGLPFAASRLNPVAQHFMTRFALVFLLAFTSISAQAMVVPSPPQIAAKAYLLVDASSGAVLAEHNADMPLPPASLTKMMTSYILAREISEGNIKETDMVTISENAWSQNPLFAGSSLMWIEPGMDV